MVIFYNSFVKFHGKKLGALTQGFSYLSEGGVRGLLIWEKAFGRSKLGKLDAV